jgi:hypothetical protein
VLGQGVIWWAVESGSDMRLDLGQWCNARQLAQEGLDPSLLQVRGESAQFAGISDGLLGCEIW